MPVLASLAVSVLARGSAGVCSLDSCASVMWVHLPRHLTSVVSWRSPEQKETCTGLLSVRRLSPSFCVGAVSEPAGTEAVWRHHAWKTCPCHSGLFSSSSFFPWSEALHDNCRTVGRWLVVILVGARFRRAPRALWVFGICFCDARSTVGTSLS